MKGAVGPEERRDTKLQRAAARSRSTARCPSIPPVSVAPLPWPIVT